jgi:hypothetical protein
MDFRLFLNRIKSLITDPVKAWENIYSGNASLKDHTFLYSLLIPGSVSAFFGSFLFSHNELRPIFFILTGIKYILLMAISVYATALIFSEISRALGVKCSLSVILRLMIHSLVPLFLCQIITRLFESFIFVNILSLFGVYIFWTGMDKLISPPENKKLYLLIAVTITFIIVFFLANWLLTRITDRIYFSVFA